ncbi:MAG TPA: ABC transporter substrate-binding protein [Deinococcales bacterium]|nr:ABC transporter substrate-binding protein [Deinococcales bacterium]
MKKLGMAIALLSLGMAAALAQSNTARPLVFGTGGSPELLDSGKVNDGNSILGMIQIYNGLVSFKPGTTEPIPALATRWTSNKDSTVWTFYIRQGVKFTDGTPLDAAAVKFNLDRWWDDKNPYAYVAQRPNSVFPDLFGGYKSDTKNSLFKSVDAVGKSIVKITLAHSFAALPAALGTGYFGIASPTAIKKAGVNYGTPAGGAVGTGAYILKSWTPGDRLVFERNPNYWKGQAKTKDLVVRIITDPAARLAELRAGSIDFTVDLSPEVLSTIKADSKIQPVFRPSFNVGYLALNPAKKPLDNVKVRQAIAMAINKKAIVDSFWGELGVANGHFTPPSMDWTYSKKVTDYTFDPEGAKKLLAAAGYPNGFDMDLWYMPVSRPYFPNPKAIAEAMAADLSAVGIRAKLQTKDWTAYRADRKTSPGFDSFMLGWTGDYGDPDNFYTPHFGPGGGTEDLFVPGTGAKLANWEDPTLTALLAQGQTIGNQAQKAALYQKVDEQVFNDYIRLVIVHSRPLLAKVANLQGWVPSPLGEESFEDIYLK